MIRWKPIRAALRNGPVAALAAAAALAPPAAPAQDAILIGDVNHYKRLPAFAEPYRKGIELALEEVNGAGGVLGRPLEFAFRDDRGEPGEAVRIAEELMTRDGAVMLTGAILSNVGLAISSLAGERGYVYLATEPLADALVWESGNDYTFRLRASTYMQASMLAEEAARTDATRFATIAPNYAYGKDAVAAFKEALAKLRPDAEFVAEQWPALFKIDAAAEAQALERAKPDAIYNVTFGTDMAKLAREGSLRGLFDDRVVLGLLGGEPEYLDPLGAEAPEGWIVTGYPWSELGDPAGKEFVDAYMERWDDHPRGGSLIGYMTVLSVSAALENAGSTDSEAIRDAFEDLSVETPVGEILFRSLDHQSTMGAYVGRTAVRDGMGTMVDWVYRDGADYLPSDAEVVARRSGN